MNFWEAILLGIVQGITEFLPVSSSGHLILVQHLLGLKNLSQYVLFDLVCHLGTLGAIFIVFASEIKAVLKARAKMALFIIALLPLPFLLPFLKPIKSLFENMAWLGFGFCITSLILLIGNRNSRGLKKNEPTRKNAFCIGIAQTLAIFPGVSRSGTTISCGRLLNLSPYGSVVFSFLLSIPTVLGGMFLEIYKTAKSPSGWPDESFLIYFCGFLSALVVGCFSLKALIRIVGTAKFQYFSWYLAILGFWLIYMNI